MEIRLLSSRGRTSESRTEPRVQKEGFNAFYFKIKENRSRPRYIFEIHEKRYSKKNIHTDRKRAIKRNG